MKIRAALVVLLLAAPPAFSDDSFEKRIRPLLVEKCIECHGEKTQKAGLRLDSRAAILKGGESGPAAVSGNPKESRLISAVEYHGELKMPPKKKLPEADAAALAEWVRRGLPWPDSKPTVTATEPDKERTFTREEKAYWAFQRVRKPEPPQVRGADWCRNPIDRFLLANMEAAGVKPAAATDKIHLLRRITFDLTGLPPTPGEVDAYVKDEGAEAYSKVVERLLASAAYGEKWGRKWLDVARFADSNGMDENLAHANAWRYRDWVIKSFNADLPYDRFVREQIAGDLIPGGSAAERNDRLTATGFLVVGPKMLAEDDPVKMRMDVIDEQLDTLGQAFLGLTFGCARCHDHKFDPITAGDYYGLAGIFYSTKTMQNYSVVARWNERPIGTAVANAALAEHDKKLATIRAELQSLENHAEAITLKRIEAERKRAADYAVAAGEVYRRRGPFRLIHADPGKDLPDGGIHVEAEAYSRGNALKLTDGYGAGIGVIINAGPLPNFAEYDVEPKKAGTFQLAVRYAAADARPIRILVDGKPVLGDACGSKTGSWNPDTQTWEAVATLKLPAGKSAIRFERDGPFPHLDKFALIPMTAEQVAASPRTVDRAAAEGHLLASLLKQWVDLLAKRNGKAPMADELAALAKDAQGPFRATPEVEAETQAELRGELKRVRDAKVALEKARPPVDEVMAVEEGPVQNLRIHRRGSHLTLGAEVPRRFPTILASAGDSTLKADRSGRLEFAEWLTRPDHPLTARVMVNRIWAGHFGTGLVRSMDNFGRLGERPTHPELLDWLADEFVKSKWSVKQLHRLILGSAAYRMSSTVDPAVFAKDPENRLFAHFDRRRLDAEELRDGMLAVAGLLDRAAGGSLLGVGNRKYVTDTGNKQYEGYTSTRRTVYLPVIRSAGFDVLQSLDFPDPSVTAGKRTTTTVPTQALLMLNSPLADQAAGGLAESLLTLPGDDGGRIREGYRRAWNRQPTDRESEKIVAYLANSERAGESGESPEKRRLRSWRGFCRVLFASNEFVFVE